MVVCQLLKCTPLYITNMKRSYTIEKKDSKHAQVWEWEETPELTAFIKKNANAKLAASLQEGAETPLKTTKTETSA